MTASNSLLCPSNPPRQFVPKRNTTSIVYNDNIQGSDTPPLNTGFEFKTDVEAHVAQVSEVSQVTQSSVGPPLEPMSVVKTGYLALFNLASAAGWSWVAVLVYRAYTSGASSSSSLSLPPLPPLLLHSSSFFSRDCSLSPMLPPLPSSLRCRPRRFLGHLECHGQGGANRRCTRSHTRLVPHHPLGRAPNLHPGPPTPPSFPSHPLRSSPVCGRCGW